MKKFGPVRELVGSEPAYDPQRIVTIVTADNGKLSIGWRGYHIVNRETTLLFAKPIDAQVCPFNMEIWGIDWDLIQSARPGATSTTLGERMRKYGRIHLGCVAGEYVNAEYLRGKPRLLLEHQAVGGEWLPALDLGRPEAQKLSELIAQFMEGTSIK